MKLGFKSEKNELAFSSSVADRWDPPDRGPHMPVSHEQSSGAARHCAATARRRRASPAVTSSPDLLLDLAHLMSQMAGPIADSRDDGGGNGGAVGLDHGGTPVEAMVRHKEARTSFHGLR